MEVSKLNFTEETKEKMGKGISFRERGRLHFERLKELDESGALSKATNRYEVARLVGYIGDKDKAGYSWVANLLNRGHLKETMIGLSPKGQMEFEYHVVGLGPLYRYDEHSRAMGKKLVEENPQIEVSAPRKTTKVEIANRDLVVKIELRDEAQAIALVKAIVKGE